MIISTGKISYKDNWWIWVDIDADLSRYLRRLFLKGHGLKLQKPSWDDHITVVSSHEKDNINKDNWYSRANDEVKFAIDLELWTNGNAYWYPVYSPELDDLRTHLGLDNPRIIPLHFAIGYLVEGKIV